MTPSEDLPTIDATTLPETPESDTVVAGVVLAAGGSNRFGERNKLLAELEAEPIVRLAVRTLLTSCVDLVVVVLREEDERVRSALEGLRSSTSTPIHTVVNDSAESGQSSSVRVGIETLQSLESTPDAVAIALGDMPSVAPETVDTLVRAHAAGVGDALAAAHEGARGNPVLFDRIHFDALAGLEGDRGGRRILLEGEDSALVNVDDPGVLWDVDTPEDLTDEP